MRNAKYLVVETGEMLDDMFEAMERFADGYNIDWYLDGKKMSRWNEEHRAETQRVLRGGGINQ
jgi:hypothetical protein